MKLLFCIFLCMSCLLVRNGTAADKFKEATEDKSLESFCQKELQRLSLEKLSSGQKKHFRAYLSVNAALNKGQYIKKKIYAAKFDPVFAAMEESLPVLQKIVMKCKVATEEALANGNDRLVARRSTALELYGKLLQANSQVLKNQKNSNQSRMDQLVQEYYLAEKKLRFHKLKVPKREWLTNREAAKLISDWYKIKESRKKQREWHE